MTAAGKAYQHLDARAFAALFGSRPGALGSDARQTLADADTRHRFPNASDVLDYVVDYTRRLQREDLNRGVRRNRQVWFKGWMENLETVRREGVSRETCRPRYFSGSRFLRFRRGIIVTPNPMLEHDLFEVARRYLFHRYLEPFDFIHELGSGSGGNLLLASEMFPDKTLTGYDWVEPAVGIAREIARQTGRPVRGRRLNMMRPGRALRLEAGSAVITIHAMEQLGTRHGPLLEALLAARPALVLHYEPMLELYDAANLFDRLAIEYTRKRNYLAGYLPRLLELERRRKLEILVCRRPGLGGVYHESSLVVWRPR